MKITLFSIDLVNDLFQQNVPVLKLVIYIFRNILSVLLFIYFFICTLYLNHTYVHIYFSDYKALGIKYEISYVSKFVKTL